MATSTFRCRHCGKIQKRNHRIKYQQYCSDKSCQQARKNRWEKEKLSKDKEYLLQRREQKAKWRKNQSGHEYQRHYRANHPIYRERNCLLQRTRNKRKLKIVKTDALNHAGLINSGIYVLSLYNKGGKKKIVKTDALIVELKSYQGIHETVQYKEGKL